MKIPTLLSSIMLFHAVSAQNPTANTKNGEVIGFTSKATFNGESKSVNRFLGIPYAEAPIGDLRFSKPVPKKPFAVPYNATYMRPACPQDPFLNPDKALEIDEDCLTVNVYVPVSEEEKKSASQLYPVFVWIYGGAFASGAANFYDSSVLAAFYDVIVVTLNYRLSVFGFLSTSDDASPGNYGLWDQHLAIQWVQDNIGAFGGDKDLVTIAGESAGSASVFYQATYPGNKGLFKRAIGESGSTLSTWAFQDFGDVWKHNLNYFADAVGCNLSDSHAFIGCLRKLPYQTIMNALYVNETVIEIVCRFTPVVDGDFVRVSPRDVFIGNGEDNKEELEIFASVDLMTGVNSMDGALFMYYWNLVVEYYTNTSMEQGCPRQVFEEVIVPSITKGIFGKDIKEVDSAVIFEYTNWAEKDNPYQTRANLVNLSSDHSFFIPAIISLNKHDELIKNSTVAALSTYFYQFSHRPSYDDLSPDYITGANHAVELPFVFGFPDSISRAFGKNGSIPARREEIILAKTMMTMWTNFVKTGDVNKPLRALPFSWPKYDAKQQIYLDFSTSMWEGAVRFHMAAERDAFWEILIPSIIRGTSRDYSVMFNY